MYYAFNANVSEPHRQHFRDAAEEWAMFANLTFIERTNQPNYILVNDDPTIDNGNASIGMLGGPQPMNIGSTAWNRVTLIHEIGHTLGLNHEHQRSDRDTYVTIIGANVPGGPSNPSWVKYSNSINYGAYDFYSVMHYARETGSTVEGGDTVVTKPEYDEFIDIMGRPYHGRCLSRGDREGIAAMYGPGPALSTVVTNTKDAGVGSLRAALYQSLDISTDFPALNPTITFQIPVTDPGYSNGVFTVRPTGRLIGPGSRVTIDGVSQTTFTGDTNPNGPEVVLNGAYMSDPINIGMGLWLADDSTTVRGLVIQGCTMQAIVITGNNNVVEGCYLGTDAAGGAAVGNAYAGVEIGLGATGNRIGGTTAAARNVISGNTSQGVYIQGTGTNGNVVQGNYIGVNAAGTAAVGNGFAGMVVYLGAQNNTIGGTVAGAGNVISGNLSQGIVIRGAGATGNSVQGNYVGLNAAGTAAVPNVFSGLEISVGAQNNTIGGTVAGAGNVFSGNTAQGIMIRDAGTSGNTVQGNLIGLNGAGTGAVGNGFCGVQIHAGAADNTIGGFTTPERNVISGNVLQGIAVSGAIHNRVAGNFIGTNPAGSAAMPNLQSGIEIYSAATGNIIGGSESGAGNVISGNAIRGLSISGAGTSNNTVAGNYLGLNAAGTTALANTGPGVGLFGGATGNTIGGTAAGAGNVISGNTSHGVSISESGTANNAVAGNRIGTNPAGTAALANGGVGVVLTTSAQGNTIGGFTASARNLISGNVGQGLNISGASSNNRVAGNFIGTNAAGAAAIPNGQAGLEIFGAATGNIVGGAEPGAGNVISGNASRATGISGAGTSGNTIAGNYLGLNAAGTATLANTGVGVVIFSAATGNTIGGTAAGAGNVISGNTSHGVQLSDAGTTGNVVAGNRIGVNPAGTAAMANGGAGVVMNLNSQGNTVGGFTTGARNQISGNTAQALVISGASSNNRVAGNYIGTNASGTGAIPNAAGGVDIFGAATGNKIGGTENGAGNLISGNTGRGVSISAANTTNNTVAGNVIGMNAAGSAALPNTGAGVGIFNSATANIIGVPNGGRNYIGGNGAMGVRLADASTTGNIVQNNSIGMSPTGTIIGNTGTNGAGVQVLTGSSGNLIGGTAPGTANLITGNAQGGVEILDTAARNTISGNSIFGNGFLGIDLRGGTETARVTANDAGDADTAANNLQNYPVLTSAVLGLGTTVNGTLNSIANATFRIEFFASTNGDTTGYGEAQHFIGAVNTTTNASGNAGFSAALGARVPAGQFVTATATDANGNTSELAQNVTVSTTDTDADGLPDAYETATGLSTSVADATADADGDGQSNLAEFRAGTDPNDPNSTFRLSVVSRSAAGVQLALSTLAGITYRLEYADALAMPTVWRTFADQVAGTGNLIPLTDPAAVALPQRFFRALVVP